MCRESAMKTESIELTPKLRFEHLLKVISSPRFLQKQGIGNEIPFFICPFPPADAAEIVSFRANLQNQLANNGVNVLEIDLYDLAIEMLRKRQLLEQVLQVESTVPKSELIELLQGVLDPEQHLIPEIAAALRDREFDVLFLSGIGEVFPYIRSHNVLNNLQSTAKEKPTVMFFPGTYTHALASGASLNLFDRLHDDKYYRAFNIFHFEV
jgi:Domain of unknown function (DUF1788)